jgi:hypothetical protein
LQVFSSPKDRQTNLNIFSYQSTPAHRHTEELQATQGDEKRYEWLTFVLSGRKAVAPVSYGIDEHGIGEPLQMYHRIALDTESEIFQKDTVFHVEGVAHTMVTQSSGQFLIMLDSFGYSSSHRLSFWLPWQ